MFLLASPQPVKGYLVLRIVQHKANSILSKQVINPVKRVPSKKAGSVCDGKGSLQVWEEGPSGNWTLTSGPKDLLQIFILVHFKMISNVTCVKSTTIFYWPHSKFLFTHTCVVCVCVYIYISVNWSTLLVLSCLPFLNATLVFFCINIVCFAISLCCQLWVFFNYCKWCH